MTEQETKELLEYLHNDLLHALRMANTGKMNDLVIEILKVMINTIERKTDIQ